MGGLRLIKNMNPTQQNNFFDALRKNWFLIVFIGGLIMGWNTFSNRLNNVESVQMEQKSDIKDLTTQTATINGAIIEIKANYIFIKSALDKISSKN